MFETEAGFAETKMLIECHGDYSKKQDYKKGWQDGATFGYNKANEWHYPSKGEFPKENKRYLCELKVFVGSGIRYECFDYDTEYYTWKNACGDVIAWKEIEPSKEAKL